MLNTELFTPVLAWLDAGAPTHNNVGFNMDHLVAENVEDFSGEMCGTVVCIAGAVQEFNNLGHLGISELAEVIGMTETQKNHLFFARETEVYNVGTMCDWDWQDTTPEQAARAVRSMLETGEVVWS